MQPESTNSSDSDGLETSPKHVFSSLNRLKNVIFSFITKEEYYWTRMRLFALVGMLVSSSLLVREFSQVLSEPLDNIGALHSQKKIDDVRKFELEETVRGHNLSVFGGILSPLVALGSLAVAYQALRTNQQSTKQTHANQVAARVNAAVDMLSSDSTVKKLAGLTSLERVCKENPSHLQEGIYTIIQFIRDEGKLKRKSTRGGISWKIEGNEKVMAATDSLLNLFCHLSQLLMIIGADSPRLSIRYVELLRCTFTANCPIRLDCVGSDLSGSVFIGADLTDSELAMATLAHCKFIKGCDLAGVKLYLSDLSYADLRGVVNLSWEQLSSAHSDGGTKLPDYLLDPHDPEKPDDFDPSQYDPEVGWRNQRYPTPVTLPTRNP